MSNSSIHHIVELFHSSSSLQLLLKPFARNSVFRHDLQWQIAHLLNSIPVYKRVIEIIENYWCFNHYKRCQGLIFGIEILKSHHNSANCVFSCDWQVQNRFPSVILSLKLIFDAIQCILVSCSQSQTNSWTHTK